VVDDHLILLDGFTGTSMFSVGVAHPRAKRSGSSL